MLNALNCEAVRSEDTGMLPGLYPVSILDINLTNDPPRVYLKSEEGWLTEGWYPLEGSQLFEPPPQRNLEELKERLKTPGCLVEALYKVRHGVPAAWYRGVLVSEAKGLYTIDLQINPPRRINQSIEQLRVIHDPVPLTRDSIERLVLEVPQGAVEEATNDRQLQTFAQHGQLDYVRYEPENRAIIVLVYGKSAAHRAFILYQFHTMHALQRQKLKDEIADMRKELCTLRTSENGLFRCEFTVPQDRLAETVGGFDDFPNLKRARQLDGIVKIMANNNHFVITAKSESAMNEARDMLDVVTEIMYVDQPFVGQIIGKQGINVQTMIKTTNIFGLFIHDTAESARNAGVDVEWKDGHVVFVITGSRAATEAAKMLIEYQLDHNRQLEQALGPRRVRRGDLSRQATEDRMSSSRASIDEGKPSQNQQEQRAGERKPSQVDHRQGNNAGNPRVPPPQPEPSGQGRPAAENQNYQENDNRRRSIPNGRPEEPSLPPRGGGGGGYRGRGRGRGGKAPFGSRDDRQDSKESNNTEPLHANAAPQVNGHSDVDSEGFRPANRRNRSGRGNRRGGAPSAAQPVSGGPSGANPQSA
ncbi:fragile X messenger ribonucleoprotein 1-like isoform X2 [Paramacrobiotus metropolitanus]|nr:fragile X messenger ribonucleoprotein 1-like isoform X2 [Paramacrobiotus metropolitanus]